VTYLFRHIINAEVVGSAAFDLPDFGKLAVGLTAFWAVEAGAAGVIGARDFSDIPLAFPAVCVFFFFVMTGCRSLPLKLDRASNAAHGKGFTGSRCTPIARFYSSVRYQL